MKESIVIRNECLSNIDLNDEFFDSLREDYFEFDNWFISKQKEGRKAYITVTSQRKITSFLMLKFEDENENYSDFERPFECGKRIKVSTFKVMDTGKKIGEAFVEIMINEAITRNVKEIYVTTFKKQEALIYLLKQYGFEFFTYKSTKKGDGSVEKEEIYVKSISTKE